MLILTRRRNERIIINDEIIVTVKRVFYNGVKISIERHEPPLPATSTPVTKESLFKRIQNRFKGIA